MYEPMGLCLGKLINGENLETATERVYFFIEFYLGRLYFLI